MVDDEEADVSTEKEPPAASKSSAYLPELVHPLLALIHPTPLSFPPPPSAHLPTTSALTAIHISALECLNNIFFSLATTHSEGTLSADAENGQRVWSELWKALKPNSEAMK